MQYQGSHKQRIAAIGRYFNPCFPPSKRSPRRFDTSELMRAGHDPEWAVLGRTVVHVDPDGQKPLENAVRCLDKDGALFLAPARKRWVIDPT